MPDKEFGYRTEKYNLDLGPSGLIVTITTFISNETLGIFFYSLINQVFMNLMI